MEKEKMTYADACLTLQAIMDLIPSDAAGVQIILKEDLNNLLQCTEAPAQEALSVIWSDGHLTGLADAMQAQRIPPLDDDNRVRKLHAAQHEIITRYLDKCLKGDNDADNEHL